MTDLMKGKHALVIGGTGGIGGAIAVALKSAGCRVIVTGKTAAEARRFQRAFPRVVARPLDVTRANAVQRLVKSIRRLDILVNAAGTILRTNREHDPAAFAEVIDVNLLGTMRVSFACRELLFQSRGCVLNIASMLSFFGGGGVPAYSASKGGIVQLTKSLAIAWAPSGVRVNALAPGWIETAMTRPLRDDPERNRAIIARTPMRRWGQPEDLAGAAVFLCSAQAAFITGAVLPVDGGYLCS